MCMASEGLRLKMAVFEITKKPLHFLRPTDRTFLFATPLKYPPVCGLGETLIDPYPKNWDSYETDTFALGLD